MEANRGTDGGGGEPGGREWCHFVVPWSCDRDPEVLSSSSYQKQCEARDQTEREAALIGHF